MQPNNRNLCRFLFPALLWFLLAPAHSLCAEKPGIDPVALERSFEMLQLEMKLEVLKAYYSRAGFFIPPEWPQDIQSQYEKLALETGQKMSLQNVDVDAWLAESRQARDNEALAMYQLVEKAVPYLLKGDKMLLEKKKFEQQMQKWQHEHNKSVAQIALYVEDLVHPIYTANRDRPADLVDRILWQNARNIYRGAVKDRDDFVKSVTAYEKTRLDIESRLVLLDQYEKGLEIAKAAQDPLGTFKDKGLEKLNDAALEKVQTYFKTYYLDVEPDKVKEVWDNRKGDITKILEMKDKLSGLDDDPVLKGNPTALGIAKRFTVMSELYNYTFGKVKDNPIMKAMGPVVDFISFYGDTVALIPDIAKRMQSVVNSVDQDFRNVRALDSWNVTDRPPGDLRQLTTFDGFGFQMATDASVDNLTAPSARFFMLVDKSLVARGYATFNSEQFYRGVDCLASERFINAPDEASRGIGDWVKENMFEWRSTNPLSPVASDAYLDDLKKKTHSSFTQKEFLDFANNLPATVNGREWTPERLRQEANRKLDVRAEEMTVRTALAGFRDEYLTEWRAFKAILRSYNVALSPKQILRLFTYYHNNKANAAHLESYLKALSEERDARSRGIARAGVPVVGPADPSQPLAAGSTSKLEASMIVTNLAPGRKISAQAVWTLPSWSKPLPPVPVSLSNGLQQISYPFDVPKNARGQAVPAKLTLQIPLESGEQAVLEAAAELQAAAKPTPVGPYATAPEKKIFREFTGTGVFDVEFSPLQIETFRSYPFPTTAFEVSSESLANLDPSQPNRGLKFSIYRSKSPGGPFVNPYANWLANDGGAMLVFPDTPIKKPTPNSYCRVDKDRVIIVDASKDGGPSEVNKPFYYQIGQVGVVRTGNIARAEGKEVRSAVIAPSQTLCILLNNGRDMNNPKPAGLRDGTYAIIGVSLSLPDRGYDVWNAHFIASNGQWTGHFWGKAAEGFTTIRVPYLYRGHKITVTATADGQTVSNSADVPPDPKEAEDATQYARKELARGDERAESFKKRLSEAEIRLKHFQELPASFSNTQDVAAARSEVRRYSEFDIPQAQLEAQQKAAYYNRDPAKELALVRQLFDLETRSMEISLEHYQTITDAARKMLRTDLSPSMRKAYEDTIKEMDSRAANARKDCRAKQVNKYGSLAECAYRAGDPAAYLQFRLAMERSKFESKQQGSQSFNQIAEEYVLLSGDRQSAARLYMMNLAATGVLNPAMRSQWQPNVNLWPPQWWPSDVPFALPPSVMPTVDDLKAFEAEALARLRR